MLCVITNLTPLFAQISLPEGLTIAAVFTVVGALISVLWKKVLRDLIVKELDPLQDKLVEKLKPYLGDDVNAKKMREALEEVETIVLDMIDTILAKKFATKQLAKAIVSKKVMMKLLEEGKDEETKEGHKLGIDLYNELEAKVSKILDNDLDEQAALSILAKMEAHEKTDAKPDTTLLKDIDNCKKEIKPDPT